MSFSSPGTRGLGGVKSTPEIQLGQILSKRTCTVDYDFTGYRAYGLPLQSTGLGIVPRNTFYYRITASGLYAPVLAVQVKKLSDVSDALVANPDGAKLANGTVVRLWDDSGQAFVLQTSGAANITVDSAGTTGSSGSSDIVTLSAAFSTAMAGSDMLLCGAGVENVRDWVIFDQEVDLRAAAKPVAVSANFTNSFIYDGRINPVVLPQWTRVRTTLQNYIRTQCQRLFLDTM